MEEKGMGRVRKGVWSLKKQGEGKGLQTDLVDLKASPSQPMKVEGNVSPTKMWGRVEISQLSHLLPLAPTPNTQIPVQAFSWVLNWTSFFSLWYCFHISIQNSAFRVLFWLCDGFDLIWNSYGDANFHRKTNSKFWEISEESFWENS